MIGHVTSSYYSPILRRSIALALVRGGLDRMGERVEVSLADGRGAIAVIASPVFYDAQGSDSMRSETDMVAAAGTARLMLESPLVGVADLLRAQEGASTRFALRERAFLDLVNVGASPPTLPSSRPSPPWRACACQPNNTVARGERYDALWLGPDEWLLRSVEPAPAGGLHARLSSALAADAAAVDVSSGYTVLEISGAQARGAGPWLPAGPAPARVQDRAMRAEPFSRRRSCSHPRATSAWIWSCAAASPTISVASCSTPRRRLLA